MLYDGVCALCNGAVAFALRRDRRGELRFAALQGQTAAELVTRHPQLAAEDTMVWVDPGGRVSIRSDAALALGLYLGGVWGFWASAARIIPRPVRDLAYGLVARVRYRACGRYAACPVPPKEHRSRFLN